MEFDLNSFKVTSCPSTVAVISCGTNLTELKLFRLKSGKSSFEIISNTFIIIAVDENNLVSGCSIDSLVNFVKELENTHDLILLDKFHVKFIKLI